MALIALLAAFLAAAPAAAQSRSAAARPAGVVTLKLNAAPAVLGLSSPLSLQGPAALLASPLLAPPPAAPVAPTVAPAAALPAKVAALEGGVQNLVESLGKTPAGAAASVHGAGLSLEALLTSGAPFAPSEAPLSPASAEALAHAAGASGALAARADDLGAAKGLKAAAMTGADFLGLLEEARASAPAAPTPAAAAAASEVEGAIIRVARALIAADKPLRESIRRALAVWQVFDQEVAIAAAKGTLEGLVAEAKLFASQVEDSVEPAPVALAKPTPADPNGLASVSMPGSVFGWQPIETSPNHGLPLLDTLIRHVLGDKSNPYAKGFEFPGAKSRSEAAVYLYGERHTDGGLITENMAHLVSDIRPAGKAIILVESYTGRSLRGHQAVEYLTARGLDASALAAKGVAPGDLEVRGWDASENYDKSQHPLLQHHMDLLELNRLAHGSERGWRYYRSMAKAALTALKSRREVWRAVIVARNSDLDRSVSQAAADAQETGATVHVIAGTDHLMRNPRLSGLPLIGRLSLRRSLLRALGGRPYWASQAPATVD